MRDVGSRSVRPERGPTLRYERGTAHLKRSLNHKKPAGQSCVRWRVADSDIGFNRLWSLEQRRQFEKQLIVERHPDWSERLPFAGFGELSRRGCAQVVVMMVSPDRG